MKLSRQQFLVGCVGLLVAPGCGDGDDGGSSSSGGSSGGGGSPAGGGSPGGGGSAGAASGGGSGGGAGSCADVIAAISNNHGHALTIPMADIEAGVEKTYDATGTSQHCHQVTLTAADFASLKAGGVVTKISCNGGDHEYVLSCGSAPGPGLPDCSADPYFGVCP